MILVELESKSTACRRRQAVASALRGAGFQPVILKWQTRSLPHVQAPILKQYINVAINAPATAAIRYPITGRFALGRLGSDSTISSTCRKPMNVPP